MPGPGEWAPLWTDRRTQHWTQAEVGSDARVCFGSCESAMSWGRGAEALKYLPRSSGLRVRTALDVESL